MLDKADVQDAIVAAQDIVDQVVAEVMETFEKPDKLLELAIQAQAMPQEAWDLLDDETVKGLMEVFNARHG